MNMKRITLFFTTLMMSLSLSVSAYAAPQFEEGVHYKVISKTASSKPVVTEYFSFFCAHCYRFEGAVKLLKEGLPAGATFEKRHVESMPLAPQETLHTLSRALAVIKKMKLGNDVTEAIFKHIHVDKKRFSDEDEIRDLFIAKGVDGKKFDSAMKNFSVKASANRMKKGWLALPTEVQNKGVPSLIVNHKYWVNAVELKSQADYTAILKFLLAK
ncbi:MAG: thiol:disulfide interchange protein DsbA [Phenylobacterium sp.]|jgi:thiol:disulfide interchange protein DsbA